MWAFQTFFINDLNSHVLQEFLTTLQTIRIAANQSIIESIYNWMSKQIFLVPIVLDIKQNQMSSIFGKYLLKIQKQNSKCLKTYWMMFS